MKLGSAPTGRTKRYVLVGLGVVLVAVLFILGWQALRRAMEPAYEGRPISHWLNQAALHPEPAASSGPSNDVIRILVNPNGMLQDPRAVPYLMDTLSRQDSAFGKMYAGLWPRLSRSWQKRLPLPTHAVYARRYAAFVLRFYESSARAAVPGLIRALRDADDLVRTHAAGSLASLGEGNPAATAGLMGTLNDTNARVRSVAAAALVHLGQKDSKVVAALETGLSDPNPSIRSYTSNALWRLSAEVKTGSPPPGGARSAR
jgi:hypothetical protein